MNPGITRIEGVVTETQIDANNRRFSILIGNGDRITYTVPAGMEHMMKGISQGIRVVIDNTASGPKSMISYPKVETMNNGKVNPKVTGQIPVTEELTPA